MSSYYAIIGIECHVQLNTVTKLFCHCLNEYQPDLPNKNICPFCTGQPGALPVLNAEAVKKAIQFGLAVKANIPGETRWDRKNYFYPDLPAGYQISQYDNPIVEGGIVEYFLEDEGGKSYRKHSVKLTRAHLEADAGKLLHVGDKTLVDFNRSGAPLIEIVSEPEIRSAAEAMGYVTELQLLVRALQISDGDMDKGQMRFDCNISLQTEEQHRNNQLPSYKVEVKNINSVRALGRAVESEIIRQTQLLNSGQTPDQETRGWRDDLNKSISQRSKEQAHDYRYFPEPDLQILEITPADIAALEVLPKLPFQAREEFLAAGMSLQMANLMVSQPEVGALYNSVLEQKPEANLTKAIASIISVNLITLAGKLEKSVLEIVTPKQIIELAELFTQDKISNQSITTLLEKLAENSTQSALEVAKENGLLQISDSGSLQVIVDDVILQNPNPVAEYRAGKVQVIGFLVGQCMKQAKGQGNPKMFKDLLEKTLAI